MSWLLAYGKVTQDESGLTAPVEPWFSLVGEVMSAAIYQGDAGAFWVTWTVGEASETVRCAGLGDLLALLRVLTPVIQLASS